MRKLLNLTEAAEKLGISRPTLRGLLDDRKIAYHRFGPRTVRIDEADLEELLKAFRVEVKT